MLPCPSQLQLKHSKALKNQIIEVIEGQSGWIGFDKYMDLALYSPDYGYYQSGTVKIGDSGDFITAPQLGDQFAGCLARQCIEIFNHQIVVHGTDPLRSITEFGAGTGGLVADILLYLDLNHSPIDHYLIVETSAELKHRQKQTLIDRCPHLLHVVSWLESIPEAGLAGVVIANELIDALPVIRYEIGPNGIANQLGVGVEDEEFRWALSRKLIDLQLRNKLSEFDLPSGYQSEIGLHAQAWLQTICESLNYGVIILIDYGFPENEYYHRDRTTGTLMCHYRHHAHVDPFLYPGLQDITAHVDFSALAVVALNSHMKIEGYCNQAAFLLSLGLLEQVQLRCEMGSGSVESLTRSQEIKKLTLPHEMGELFKVLALSKNHDLPLTGFNMQNHMIKL